MRYGRRSGTAPTRFRITSLNRHSGGAPAGAALSEAIRAEGIRTEFFSDTDEPETLAGRLLFPALSAAALAQPTDEPSDHEHG